MAQLLDPFRTRILAVIQGRGNDGSLGTDALARAVPNADQFRPTDASPRQAAFPAQAYDRGLFLRWDGVGDHPFLDSRMADYGEREFSLVIEVGYIGTPAQSGMTHLLPSTSETAANAARYARERALSDAERIDRALTWYELTGGSLDANNQSIIEVTRELNKSPIEELPDGRLLLTMPYAVRVWMKLTASNLP